MAQRGEEYVKVYLQFEPELRRKIKAEDRLFVAALFRLALSMERGNQVNGTQEELADYAGVHLRTMRRYLLRIQALGLGKYDMKRRILELNPLMVFRGSEKERKGVIERWVKGGSKRLRLVKARVGTKADRVAVLEVFLETPAFVAACARGAGMTEEEIREVLRKLIADGRAAN